ncbi:MAG: NYN domain-containing protein [bacterium]|nr:NYN domain-containing protein [bacterium]
MEKNQNSKIYAFIDASNLFYGGVKSLGWKIDYQKLLEYLREKYNISKAFYYAGIEIYKFSCSILDEKPIDLEELLEFLKEKLKRESNQLSEAQIILLERNIGKTKFYLKLKEFGYILRLKPTKIYKEADGTTKKKANCDVDMTFDIMKMINEFDEIIVLSGDGDFAVLLKYLAVKQKKVIVLARSERTAKEMRQLVGGDFRDFHKIRNKIEFFG